MPLWPDRICIPEETPALEGTCSSNSHYAISLIYKTPPAPQLGPSPNPPALVDTIPGNDDSSYPPLIMFAQYSPLFTAGLLSDSSPAASRAPSPLYPARRQNHDSLPLTVNTRISDIYTGSESPQNTDGALFLTFRPHRKQIDEEGLSFLSLDLAESQTMRSMSLRRKDTVTTRATTAFGRSEPSSPSRHSPVSPIAKRLHVAPQLPPISPVSSLRRPSRETLRLPSPKPAPSTSLPELPPNQPNVNVHRSLHRRKPSNLTLTLSACFAEAGPSSTSTSSSSPSMTFHPSSLSAPSAFSPLSPPLHSSPILSPTQEQSYFIFSPTSPVESLFPEPPPPSASTQITTFSKIAEHAPAPAQGGLKPSLSMRSTATFHTRQRNRSAALAALEGRGGRSKHRTRPNNFMSMSDDEEDEMANVVDEETLVRDVKQRLLWVLNEEEDVVIPKSRRESGQFSVSVSPHPGSKRESITGSGSKSSSSTLTSSSGKRSRRSTIESFFSLNNFMDLKDDEHSSPLSWRSFVEFSA